MNLPDRVYGHATCADDTSSRSARRSTTGGERIARSTPGGSVIDVRPVVVAGAGGFIGGHLVASLVAQGRRVRAVDVKPLEEWFQHAATEEMLLDLSQREACEEALDGAGEVYNLAADMGGMGFIENNRALCMLSVLINTHLL